MLLSPRAQSGQASGAAYAPSRSETLQLPITQLRGTPSTEITLRTAPPVVVQYGGLLEDQVLLFRVYSFDILYITDPK